ncbi:MAG: DUF1294 domain-containing protein [Planctomycetota bacterium]|jgi:uncharacterized membrane protein YsdA (DUF1294 family)
MLRVLIAYLVFVNLLTYAVYWMDKRRAERGRRRISERELLLWALAGGTVGALLAMRRLRHKTKKRSFQIALYIVILVQVAAVWLVLRT